MGHAPGMTTPSHVKTGNTRTRLGLRVRASSRIDAHRATPPVITVVIAVATADFTAVLTAVATAAFTPVFTPVLTAALTADITAAFTAAFTAVLTAIVIAVLTPAGTVVVTAAGTALVTAAVTLVLTPAVTSVLIAALTALATPFGAPARHDAQEWQETPLDIECRHDITDRRRRCRLRPQLNGRRGQRFPSHARVRRIKNRTERKEEA